MVGALTAWWDSAIREQTFMKIPNFPSYSPQPLIINAGKLFRRPIPRENSGGAGVLGTVTDGDTATEGTLTTNNPQAGMITQAGMYRMTLDMMEYTYTLEELGFAPYIYEIGNNTSWSGTCPLAGINFDGKYRGFAYLNGEFKYKPNPEKDNWTGDWEKSKW